jgi:hypothetical protein
MEFIPAFMRLKGRKAGTMLVIIFFNKYYYLVIYENFKLDIYNEMISTYYNI